MYFIKIILLITFLSIATALDFRKSPLGLLKKTPVEKIPEEKNPQPLISKVSTVDDLQLQLEQNKNAKYEFATDIKDDINGLENFRHEIRDGLKLVGQYSYSDGYFKRTVYYEADETGYRVTKQEEEPLLEGPKINHQGFASVSTTAHGTPLTYKVKSILKDDDYVIEQVE